MRERSIVLPDDMVRQVLSGKKTMFREVSKSLIENGVVDLDKYPYSKGDTLYVKENFKPSLYQWWVLILW